MLTLNVAIFDGSDKKYCSGIECIKLKNSFIRFNVGEAQNFSLSKSNYIYLINIHSNICKVLNNKSKIDDLVKEDCKHGLGKILFFFPMEGYIRETDVDCLNNFCIENNLPPSSVIFAHSSLNLENYFKSIDKTLHFSYTPISYYDFKPFNTNLFGLSIPKALLTLDKYVTSNRNKNIIKHFNIPIKTKRLARLLLFTEIKTNKTIKPVTDISLGKFDNIRELHFDSTVKEVLKVFKDLSLKNNYFSKNYEYVKSIDLKKTYELDKSFDLPLHKFINREFYSNYFCSVVAETHINSNTVFITEKTFKPIANLHPFISYSSKGSLKYLQNLGYKTFSEWWDESYDNEANYYDRLIKIIKIMEDIASWSHDKLFTVTQEMEKTLIHNYINFIYNRRYENFISKLAFFKNNQETNISQSYRWII